MKMFVSLVVFLLILGIFVAADDRWDSFSDSDNFSSDEGSSLQEGGETNNLTRDVSGDFVHQETSSGKAYKYTSNFYVALGVGAAGLLILIILILSFLIKPRNWWKKKS